MNALFGSLKHQTIRDIRIRADEVEIETDAGTFRLYHDQDCCESVLVQSVVGDRESVTGSPITLAEEDSVCGEGSYGESWTDTKFFLEAAGKRLEIVFHGESNGCYREGVDIEFTAKEPAS